MRRLMTKAAAVVLPALMASVLAVGCGGGEKTEPTKTEGTKTNKVAKTKGPKKLEKLASTGWGTLKGRVTLEGSKPNTEVLNKDLLAAIEGNKDKDVCLAGSASEKDEQKWRIGKDNGVGQVFVWLTPPEGKYFDVDTKDKTWSDEVAIDQPHCAFKPHAAVLFPSHYNPDNPDEPVSTGQKFVIKNSAPINHNTAWKGGADNPGDNKILPSKTDLKVELKPDPDPVMLHCDIHKWMDGVVRVFDHPYAAVTDDDGNFEIKHVPAGAELNVVVWHEVGGYGSTGEKGEKATLKDGENKKDFTVKAAK